MNRKFLKKYVNTKYFDFPANLLESFIKSRKFHYIKTTIENLKPGIIVCNKSTNYDQFLIRLSIPAEYVTLKEKYINQIYTNTLSKEDKKNIINEIKMLNEYYVSVVVFPESQITIFGKSTTLPLPITEFLYETGANLKFINFRNSYFIKPIWSKHFRTAHTILDNKFNLANEFLKTLSPDERNSKINKSIYQKRYDRS